MSIKKKTRIISKEEFVIDDATRAHVEKYGGAITLSYSVEVIEDDENEIIENEEYIPTTSGYVYFIQMQNQDGYIKIGFESTENTRSRRVHSSSPYPFKCLARLKALRPFEGMIHGLLKKSRVKLGGGTEFFIPSEEVMKCIEKVNESITNDNIFHSYFFKEQDRQKQEKRTAKLKEIHGAEYDDYINYCKETYTTP